MNIKGDQGLWNTGTTTQKIILRVIVFFLSIWFWHKPRSLEGFIILFKDEKIKAWVKKRLAQGSLVIKEQSGTPTLDFWLPTQGFFKKEVLVKYT